MSSPRRPLLVVAGEASGDRIASEVLRALRRDAISSFGIGGSACTREGMKRIVDVSELGIMGTLDVARSAATLGRALDMLARHIFHEKPSAALLVNFTELNARLGWMLRRVGVRVLWVVAPQVWAWRKSRLKTLHGSMDKLAVILPFEEKLWREAGYDATYVGHPSFDVPRLSRSTARHRLGLHADQKALVVLPGSRTAEVERMAPVLTRAAMSLLERGDAQEARVLRAPGLSARAQAVLQGAASAAGIETHEADADLGAAPLLAAFDLALATSGTACLEATLQGLPTVIGYRTDRLTYELGKRLIRSSHIALPNVLLGRRAFPELIQEDATEAAFADAAGMLLDPASQSTIARDLEELRDLLTPPMPGSFGERVANLLRALL